MGPAQHATSADGTPIGYRTSGDGEPLLLVHGVATTGADWLFVRQHLRERFSVVMMDRRGRGVSGDGPEHSLEREAEDVLAVLEAIDGRLLVGHSYGALCSIEAAQRTDRLERLVLYEPPIAVQPAWLEGLEDRVAAGDLDDALEAFLRAAGTSDEQLEMIRNSPAWPTLLEAVPSLPRELRACTLWRVPESPIDVPTLFLLGAETKSPAYLEGLDTLLAAFTDLRQEKIKDQMHVAHIFDVERFADRIASFAEGMGPRTALGPPEGPSAGAAAGGATP
jgi:pimeloyl-ACP methyl ester carboxylesterase